jgi:hypothetical protein
MDVDGDAPAQKEDFALRCELHGHQEDVRCFGVVTILDICAQGEGRVISLRRAIHASLRAQRVQRSAVRVYALRAHIPCDLTPNPTKQQVRGVAACDVGLLTGSRDRTVKVWAPEGAHCFTAVRTLTGNTGFVGPVAYAPPGLMPNAPNGAVISGAWSYFVFV